MSHKQNDTIQETIEEQKAEDIHDYYQSHDRELQDFVNREVIYCVSQLVYEMFQGKGADNMAEEYYESLYQGSPSYGDYECPECFHTWDGEPGEEDCPDCSFNGIDDNDFQPTEYREVLEHWIVTDWLADRLAEQGETVCKDFYGLTIWGRTCSGQGISCDGVISQIYKNLHSK